MSRVVVAVDGEVTMRAAQSLVVQPGIEAVALLAPTRSPRFPTIDSPLGWDLLLGSERAAQVAADNGLPVAVTGVLIDQPGVSFGSPIGLALSLAVGIDGVETVAVALPGTPAGGDTVVFPSPLDARNAIQERYESQSVHVARGDGPLAAALALGSTQHRVVLDDHSFLEGVALAAAAIAALDRPLTAPAPVWTRAGSYLQAAAGMGLVIGERTTAA